MASMLSTLSFNFRKTIFPNYFLVQDSIQHYHVIQTVSTQRGCSAQSYEIYVFCLQSLIKRRVNGFPLDNRNRLLRALFMLFVWFSNHDCFFTTLGISIII